MWFWFLVVILDFGLLSYFFQFRVNFKQYWTELILKRYFRTSIYFIVLRNKCYKAKELITF